MCTAFVEVLGRESFVIKDTCDANGDKCPHDLEMGIDKNKSCPTNSDLNKSLSKKLISEASFFFFRIVKTEINDPTFRICCLCCRYRRRRC